MRLRKLLCILTCCLFMLFSLAACGDKPVEENVTYYSLKVKAGDEFDITLDSPYADGGYDWKFRTVSFENSTNSDIRLINEKHIPYNHPGPTIFGDGEKIVYTFETIVHGDYEIRFEYRRWWEKEVPAEKIVVYKIKAVSWNLTHEGEEK